MTAQHTPDPWVHNGNGLIYGQAPRDGNGEAPFVADCAANPDTLTKQEEANAHMIAAAPELLAALEGFVLGASSEKKLADVVGEDVVREAHAAIALARGKT